MPRQLCEFDVKSKILIFCRYKFSIILQRSFPLFLKWLDPFGSTLVCHLLARSFESLKCFCVWRVFVVLVKSVQREFFWLFQAFQHCHPLASYLRLRQECQRGSIPLYNLANICSLRYEKNSIGGMKSQVELHS